MKTRIKTLLLLVLLFPATLVAGSKKMPLAQSVCDEIEDEIPGAQFERESHIRLGRIAMTLAKPIVRWALNEDDEARAMIKHIKRVDIATYRVADLPETLDTAVIRRIESRFAVSLKKNLFFSGPGMTTPLRLPSRMPKTRPFSA